MIPRYSTAPQNCDKRQDGGIIFFILALSESVINRDILQRYSTEHTKAKNTMTLNESVVSC